METTVTLTPARRTELGKIRRLYKAAFPLNERKPFALLRSQQARGIAELLSIRGDGRFLGLIIVVRYEDMALLDFFAISPDARSLGVGGKALRLLAERYVGKRLFLEIERNNPGAENALQRARRKAFYLKNGMQESGVFMQVYGCDMELMHAGKPVGFRDYCRLLRATLGPFYYRIKRPQEDAAR